MGYEEYLNNVKSMIDDLKAMTADLSLANSLEEYNIISVLFTYKFLNDKLLYAYENREDMSESFNDFINFADSSVARIKEEYLLNNLFQKQNEEGFYRQFNTAITEISNMNADVYSIEKSSGEKIPLMEPISKYVADPSEQSELAKRAINIMCKYKFGNIYEKGWDYFSSIFEYLIKDYNKDSGKYAEYYTPASAGAIMADILYDDTPVDRVSIYDPAAGSGTLLMSMADKVGTKNCTLYSQDRARKSTQFLRINLILNNLAHSLENVVQGNTMTNPDHKTDDDHLQQFDFIISNPPFNVDFSADVETMKADRYGRFFAGVPNVPKKDKTSMAIYQCFLQHILASLKPNGKAAIVVPTGFLSTVKGIPKKIREEIISHNWLKGAVSMPSNIFATTGTSVSIIFLDKSRSDDNDDIVLIEASNLGKKVKLENGQKTILSEDDEQQIINIFKQKKTVDDFSVVVKKKDIVNKQYSFSATQYFDIKINYIPLTNEEYEHKIKEYKSNLKNCFDESRKLEEQLFTMIERFEYE